MDILLDVFDNYEATKEATGGKTNTIGAPDQIALTQRIPDYFRETLARLGRADEFLVKGSYGNSNMARVPWVGIFNLKVTNTAQQGFYIVLLFSEDMQSCYLSLNQGFTAFTKAYSTATAKRKIEDAAKLALHSFETADGAVAGVIDLSATGDLGEGYEKGAIESFRYERDDLPTRDQLAHDFGILLEHYDALTTVVKASLQELLPANEDTYQQAVLERAASKRKKKELIETGKPVPRLNSNTSQGYARSPAVAAEAIERAGFKCEVDPSHQTFVSKAKGAPYVEAHHLVPMSCQEQFDVSLDVVSNVVALCPLCHRTLHFARALEKRQSLLKLFAEREARLKLQGIEVDAKWLQQAYKADLIDDED